MQRDRVLFDGDCRFCQGSIALIRRLDWLHRLDYQDVRQDTPLLHAPPVAGAPLLDQMHLLTPAGRLYGGYAAIRQIAWRLPLLWLAAPVLYLPGVAQLGDLAYRWVARNRFRLIPCAHGACEIPNRGGARPPVSK